MEEQQTFGQWLRYRRRQLDLTQEALGRQSGCAQVTIRKIESDLLKPSRELARLLIEHLGVPPDEHSLYIDFARSGKTPSKSPSPRTLHHLPRKLTSFIGREREVEEIKSLLRGSRLVTITGSGGVGKSRLALHMAEQVLETYPDGVWFVELAPITDADLVTQAVAINLGLQRAGEVSYQSILINYLQYFKALLILDNCEHLLDACIPLVDMLLKRCPHLTILITCRERFDVPGEAIYRVPSLRAVNPAICLDTNEYRRTEAVQLFYERATLSVPGFALTDQTLPAAAQICYRLDGIPLAIELAAARTSTLSVEQIADRLEDLFRLLVVGDRTALPRHRTLRASIDWSYSMLPEAERLLLQRLAVFSGGWNLEAAEVVCSSDGLDKWEILDALTSLVNRSLVVAESTTGSQYRYHMLETIRQYAQEKGNERGENAVLSDRHLAYFVSFAQREGPRLKTNQISDALLRIDADLDNLRSALAWAFAQGNQVSIETALDILISLDYYWSVRALYWETFPRLQRALANLPEDENQTSERKAWGYYVLSMLQSDHFMEKETLGHLAESVRLFRQVNNPHGLAIALSLICYLGFRYNFFFQPYSEILDKNAAQAQKESIAIVQEYLHDPSRETQFVLAWVDCWNNSGEMFRDAIPTTSPFAYRALERFKSLGDIVGEIMTRSGIVYCISPEKGNLLTVQEAEENLQLAKSIDYRWHQWLMHSLKTHAYKNLHMNAEFEESALVTISFAEEIGQFRGMKEIYNDLVDFYIARKQYDQARNYLYKALTIQSLEGMQEDLFETFEAISNVIKLVISLGQQELAARLLGFLERMIAEYPERNKLYEPYNLAEYKEMFKDSLARDDIQAAWKEGQSMTFEQAITTCLEMTMGS